MAFRWTTFAVTSLAAGRILCDCALVNVHPDKSQKNLDHVEDNGLQLLQRQHIDEHLHCRRRNLYNP
jgi:hypothetical protein